MLTVFDRYLTRRYIEVFLILFASTFGLYVVIDGFTNVDAFQENAESAADAAKAMGTYYAYQASPFFNMVGPILAVISVMVVFGLLVKNSELQPVLAAGIPTFRLLRPFLIGAIGVNCMMIANQEILLPRIAHHLTMGRGKEENHQKVEPTFDHSTHIQIDGTELVMDKHQILQASFVLPVPSIASELTTIHAEEARYLEQDGDRPAGWHLINAKPTFAELELTGAGQQWVLPLDDPHDIFIATVVNVDQLTRRSRSFTMISTTDLLRRIRNPAFGTITVRSQLIHLHTRLTAPLGNILCVFVAVPLIVRRESVSLITNMAVCTGVLGVIYGLTQAARYLAATNMVPIDFCAWLPVIVIGAIGAWVSGLVQT